VGVPDLDHERAHRTRRAAPRILRRDHYGFGDVRPYRLLHDETATARWLAFGCTYRSGDRRWRKVYPVQGEGTADAIADRIADDVRALIRVQCDVMWLASEALRPFSFPTVCDRAFAISFRFRSGLGLPSRGLRESGLGECCHHRHDPISIMLAIQSESGAESLVYIPRS